MTAMILVVEDEKDLVTTLENNLQREGYRTCSAQTGEAALELLGRAQVPDLVLLDLILPDISGVEVCKKIREQPRTRSLPVIMITAKGEEIDRVVGFEVGTDDYVVKPFSVRELLLRIRALLRRSNEEPTPQQSPSFGCLCLDTAAHRALVLNQEVILTALEFDLLLTLLERRGRVQTRDTLLNDVWGISADVTTRTVDTHVKRLRKKLGPAGEYIETVRGVGYRFQSEE
jgi:two-component system, OmpR family, phosphate regulon response regulator PhoB